MPSVSKATALTTDPQPETDSVATDEAGPGAKKRRGSEQRPPPEEVRYRLDSTVSDATRSVLAVLHGPVYAMDRRPHLAQHVVVPRSKSSPAQVAAAIVSAVADALNAQAVRWNGLPALSQYQRDLTQHGYCIPLVLRASLPLGFPEPRAAVVWAGDTGIAGRGLCIEFVLTETPAGVITGFSYRYDLSGTPFLIAVAAAPPAAPPAPKKVKLVPVDRGITISDEEIARHKPLAAPSTAKLVTQRILQEALSPHAAIADESHEQRKRAEAAEVAGLVAPAPIAPEDAQRAATADTLRAYMGAAKDPAPVPTIQTRSTSKPSSSAAAAAVSSGFSWSTGPRAVW